MRDLRAFALSYYFGQVEESDCLVEGHNTTWMSPILIKPGSFGLSIQV